MNTFIVVVLATATFCFAIVAVVEGCAKKWIAMTLAIILTIFCCITAIISAYEINTYAIEHLQEQTVSYVIVDKNGKVVWSFLKTDVNFKISDQERIEVEIKFEKVKDVTIYMPQEKISEFLQ